MFEPAAPYVARRLLDPVMPGVGRHGRTLLAVGAATAVLTTIGDVVRRRVRDGRLPDPQTVPAQVREVQEELAGIRLGPAVQPGIEATPGPACNGRTARSPSAQSRRRRW